MNKKNQQIKLFCEFVIPPMLIWARIVVAPLFYGLYLTFTTWNCVANDDSLVGLTR